MWSQAFVGWLYHAEEALLLIQVGTQTAVRKGWQPLLCEAATSGQGGTLGGVGVLHKAHWDIHQHHHFVREGCGWTAVVLEERPQAVLLISIYLKNSVGLEADINASIIAALMACLQQWKGPWLVVGDWNVEPSQVLQSQIPSLLKGEVIAPEGATVNTGSLLDFVLASRDLRPHLKLEVSSQAPWKPHGLLQIWRDFEGQQLAYPIYSSSALT